MTGPTPWPTHKTIDPTPTPPEKKGTEAPVDNTHKVTDGSDIGGEKVKE